MVDKREQHSEHDFEHDHRHDHEHEQQSSSEMHPLRSAFPTRAQQERHRHNLRMNGQVEFDDGSVSRHATKERRRDSWIDRINSSTKEAIRRTSVIAAVDEKKLIDKVADSINDYGEHHLHDSWTDKVLDFLFPSLGLDTGNDTKSEELLDIRAEETPASAFDGQPTPAMSPSDLSYDQVQQSKSIEELMLWAIETADLMDSTDQAAMNQHAKLGMKPETSDLAYDHLQAEYPDDRSVKCYGDALEKQFQINDCLSMSPTWSVYDDLQQQTKTKKHSHSHSHHHSQWPLHPVVNQNPIDTQSIESAKKDRRRHRQQLRKQGIDTFAG